MILHIKIVGLQNRARQENIWSMSFKDKKAESMHKHTSLCTLDSHDT